MITQDDLARLPRWQIREPNHKEFEKFKKEYLLKKAQTTKEKELLRYIGELQSEIDTLKHALATCQKMNSHEYKAFMIQMMKAEIDYKSPVGSKKKMRQEIERMQKVLIQHNLTW